MRGSGFKVWALRDLGFRDVGLKDGLPNHPSLYNPTRGSLLGFKWGRGGGGERSKRQHTSYSSQIPEYSLNARVLDLKADTSNPCSSQERTTSVA